VADRIAYDEFGLFHENAEEFGLPFEKAPVVRRVWVEVAPGRKLSALVWKDDEPQLVLLHGGAQNAHTWDTVAMALDRPLVALDLPGHGHSDGRGEQAGGRFSLESDATDVAGALRQLAPAASAVVGMSLGGLTAIALARQAPELVRKVILVDVLPGIKDERAEHILDFMKGPPTFDSLDDLLDWTATFNPTRSLSSLRRGILHNAEQQGDGTWMWRWARHRRQFPSSGSEGEGTVGVLNEHLWDSLSLMTSPLLLARGMRDDSVVDDEDEEELRRRLSTAKIVHFDGAGHSIQGDSPLELAALIQDFVFGE
jgi:pimeloyl-ACP methyl ester carboxylesterase